MDLAHLIPYFGTAAAFLTTASFLPQVIKTLHTRDTGGISLIMYVAFVVGVALWFVYGLLLHEPPIWIGNAVTLVLSATVLTMKIINIAQGKD